MAHEIRPASVVLIDDNKGFLQRLRTNVDEILRQDDIEVRSWQPVAEDEDPIEVLDALVDEETALVATDLDLTEGGMKGLFGGTIVDWCKRRFVPVGDFSRANEADLETRPPIFEFRVPSDTSNGAEFIAATARGFRRIKKTMREEPSVAELKRSPAGVLSWLMGREHLYSQIALYMSGLTAELGVLIDYLDRQPSPTNSKIKVDVLTYMLGHVLANVVLRYPGPVLSEAALCAYVGVSENEALRLRTNFRSAKYDGPFGDEEWYFWRDGVDSILDGVCEGDEALRFESFGQYNYAQIKRQGIRLGSQ